MRREFYQLANKIDSSAQADTEEAFPAEQYKKDVLRTIRADKRKKKRRHAAAAAACIAVAAVATAVFHKEVQAAIEQIRYSLSAALGKDMSQYSKAVHTSVSDAGYRITLEDVIVAQEQLLVSYTVQREDGQKLAQDCSIAGRLWINGIPAAGGAGSSGGYLDKEQKIYGCQVSYQIPDADLSGTNRYELAFQDRAQKIQGNWKIKFEASGSELFAETKTMAVGISYPLPGGNTLTLDTLSLNELAHQVTFHTAKKGLKNDIELRAADDQGTQLKFSMSEFENGKGIFKNSYLIENGEPTRNWIAKDAKTLTVTVYISGLSETDAEDGWKQIGEAMTLDLRKLKQK